MAEIKKSAKGSTSPLTNLTDVTRYMDMMREFNPFLFSLMERCAREGILNSYSDHLDGVCILGLIVQQKPGEWKPSPILTNYFEDYSKDATEMTDTFLTSSGPSRDAVQAPVNDTDPSSEETTRIAVPPESVHSRINENTQKIPKIQLKKNPKVEAWFIDVIVPEIHQARNSGDYSTLTHRRWMKEDRTLMLQVIKATMYYVGRQKAFYEMLETASKVHSDHLEHKPLTSEELEKIRDIGREVGNQIIAESKSLYSPDESKKWVIEVLRPYVLKARAEGNDAALTPMQLINVFGYHIRHVAEALSVAQDGGKGTTSIKWLLNQPYSGFRDD